MLLRDDGPLPNSTIAKSKIRNLNFPSDYPDALVRLARCPLCPDSDQILQRSEMSRCANFRHRAAVHAAQPICTTRRLLVVPASPNGMRSQQTGGAAQFAGRVVLLRSRFAQGKALQSEIESRI
jgi:hypothetical protein